MKDMPKRARRMATLILDVDVDVDDIYFEQYVQGVDNKLTITIIIRSVAACFAERYFMWR